MLTLRIVEHRMNFEEFDFLEGHVAAVFLERQPSAFCLIT
jgi:hypothetical protein